MKTLKRISLIFVAILILIVPVSVNCFAVDPVSFTEATTLGATIVDLYGAVNNTSLAYDAIQPNGALTEIVTLYQNYSSSASDPYTLAAIGAAAAAAGAIAVVYDAVTGQGYVQLYQEQYISSLDGYWDYQLGNIGLLRDSVSGLYNWVLNNNQEVTPIVIYANQVFPVLPYSTRTSADVTTFNESQFIVSYILNGGRYYKGSLVNNSNNIVTAFLVPSNNGYTIYYISDVQYTSFRWLAYDYANNSWATGTLSTNQIYNYNNHTLYYRTDSVSNGSNYDVGISVFTSSNDGFNSYINDPNAIENNISIEPSSYIGDPLQNPLEITIPDVSDPDYIPQPRRINTNIPWNPDWGNPLPDGDSIPDYGVPYTVSDPEILNNAVPGIWDYIVSNPIEVEDPQLNPDPDPSPEIPNEVYTPFLPVTLPSFNFSFSGIWNYVREWVASLGAWFTMVFEVWSHLPYAIVVPVFASAVIVIVLGVYKRFFM